MSTASPEHHRTEAAATEIRPGRVFQRLDLINAAPYSRTEYVRRAAWMIVYATLFRWSPWFAHGWRRLLLRLFGARIGRAAVVRRTVRIVHPWLLSMGDFSAIGEEVEVYNLGAISIGAHSVVSQRTHLCAGTHDYRRPDLPLVRARIDIGNGVWICADAFVGPDTTVGDNAIVAARAVVTRDVDPATIVGGNPARPIRDRPAPEPGSEASP